MEQGVSFTRFSQAINRAENEISLAECALILSLDEYPNLEPDHYLLQIDDLTARFEKKLTPDLHPEHRIYRLNQFLFRELRFRGNRREYYDPRNNYLNELLDRRRGGPVVLSLLYCVIGRGGGLNLRGLPLPGYFLVKYSEEGRNLLVDPFHRGRVVNREDLDRITARFGVEELDPDRPSPVGNRIFLLKLLESMQQTYLRLQDHRQILGIIEKRFLLEPDSPQLLRERGRSRLRLGEYEKGIEDLTRYLHEVPEANDQDEVEREIKRASQRMERPQRGKDLTGRESGLGPMS